METSIRKVRDSDLQTVVDIDKTLFGAESFLSFSMRQFINLFPDSFYVAEQNAVVIGYGVIGVRPSAKDAWLLSIGVLEPHQNQGIGAKLLAACDAYCQSLRIETFRLTTDPENSGAIRLYKTFGFQIDCEICDYYELGDRKLLMIKTYDDKSA
ncbi:MAG: GNAT family N-acetyltransferase [Pseudomonadota bacterium]